MKNTYLTPGPSELYFTVDFHLKQAFKKGIPSISHRSNEFRSIYSSIKEDLPQLLNLPDNFKILFTSSATEVWERITQNLISKESFHFTNGAFADKFVDTVKSYQNTPGVYRVEEGQAFDLSTFEIPESAELISITQNETSTGTRFPLEDISMIRQKYPQQIITVDAVSSIPYEKFDFTKIDTLYFSVQKCFGLPAGLGIWLVNERCEEKANLIKEQNGSLGSYHSLPSLLKMYEKDQTPETPNVLGMYLFSKVIQDILSKGIDQIRREINYKAALMYQTLSVHNLLNPFVRNEEIRSKTVIVANHPDVPMVLDFLKSNHLVVGNGYGKFKNLHIRIANFPTHSKELFERLADKIDEISE